MRTFALLILSTVALLNLSSAFGNDADSPSWAALRAKREALKSFHEVFEVSRTFKTANGNQSLTRTVVIDGVGRRWREQSSSGAGGRVTVFDGQNRFEFEDGGAEYVRLKSSSGEDPQPDPYSETHLNFSKAVERGTQSCGLSKLDHMCVTVEIPIMPSVSDGGIDSRRSLGGSKLVTIDTTTGLVISARAVENVVSGNHGFQSDTIYKLKQLSYNGDVTESLFSVPSSAGKEVKKLSAWDARKMTKQLAGKTAPDVTLTDIQGHKITLSELKGKTVLLDFWATWCGPCRADGPALDKLYKKYGGDRLSIIGVSVAEERPIVQKFLAEHPHPYPIALSTENEMPRSYEVDVFPTYMVIDSDGNFVSAAEGDQGFSELRKLLKKAGLDTE